MLIAPSAFALPRPLVKPAIAIGNFDGVHLGHRMLVERALEAARANGPDADAVVLTFDPHPASVLARGVPPAITSLGRRLELLAALGLTATVVQPFDRAFAQRSAESFVRDVLVGALHVATVVVGSDFRFGAGRSGEPAALRRFAEELGFSVVIVDKLSVDGEVCSSSRIREHVRAGRVAEAARLLGRPFALDGVVVHGEKRGRTIGYPTANLALAPERLCPVEGIYAGWAILADGTRHKAAISVGKNPTFGDGGPRTIEAYLLDWQGDLYDQTLRLELVAHLRGEQKFASVDALVAQIEADVAATRSQVS